MPLPLPRWLATLEARLLQTLARRAARRSGQAPTVLPEMPAPRDGQAEWMRCHDALTGLYCRSAFMESVLRLLARGVSGSLAIVDLDHFKKLNHEHGHEVGDMVVQCMASRIQASVTADVTAARCGGDEFLLFMPGPVAQARSGLERVMAAIRQPVDVDGKELTVTACIGLAPLRLGAGVPDAARLRARFDRALSSADMAMYVAKSDGRDRLREFDDEMAGVATARRELAKTVATLSERNRALEEQVELDALTGLRSRRALEAVLPTACGGAGAQARPFAVVFLDIDHFHDYNHHHGDHQGDEALRRVAQLVQAAARRGDLVFRKGGEEFVVVLPDAGDAEARLAAERIRSAVEQAGIPHRASPTAQVMTITVGVAASQVDQPVTLQALMVRAAQAAMRAKVQAQRNQVHAG